jgi:hypothetical protein
MCMQSITRTGIPNERNFASHNVRSLSTNGVDNFDFQNGAKVLSLACQQYLRLKIPGVVHVRRLTRMVDGENREHFILITVV